MQRFWNVFAIYPVNRVDSLSSFVRDHFKFPNITCASYKTRGIRKNWCCRDYRGTKDPKETTARKKVIFFRKIICLQFR